MSWCSILPGIELISCWILMLAWMASVSDCFQSVGRRKNMVAEDDAHWVGRFALVCPGEIDRHWPGRIMQPPRVTSSENRVDLE